MKFVELLHEWRGLIAGMVAVFVGVFDLWHYGREAGLSVAVDEALILLGVSMIAGTLTAKRD